MERRVGVFGGTFDPPHVAHVVVAAEVRHALELDVVLFVVAHDPWQKSGERQITDPDVRLEMVRAALAGTTGLQASDVELRRGGPSYTVDTLRTLRSAGAEELFLVLGRDAAAEIETWHDPEGVRSLCTPVVVARPGAAAALPDGWAWREVAVPELDVSSTALRDRVAAGRPIDGMVAPGVRAVIEAHHLYRSARD